MKVKEAKKMFKKNYNPKSAWSKGVKLYALDLFDELIDRITYLEGVEPCNEKECRRWMLNGAQDWKDYSYGGCSLIYNQDIAKRLCTATELKKTHNGYEFPNKRENWLDVQSRALYQACELVIDFVYGKDFQR